ncbi:hypothetical protein SAMN04488550_2893 [Gordonia malaquae]|uniref:Helix-turn-helix domain-containing protein n=1 Tax=Gordonia malaquae NBRC 108250 TaxID=1223542 RepID=M3UHE6_GORML|nr:helix-turn-helix domain-containing protein [Gordonia malaquae]GAC78765.1 hypothetical protein GM1_004_02100 [Gordonia malaquae NBRC 108250]SED64912.1 hypothetical protein SAMN04488550_2893 [Gordonia malaquae]
MGCTLEVAALAAPEMWTTGDAVAAGWGYSTVRKYITDGLMPSAEKVQGQWRFDRAELEALREPVPADIAPAVEVLSDPVREWTLEQVASAPPMNAREARVVAAIFRRTAKAGVAG